jgi:glycosyltransferase involved in cell wall biosynthesis
MAQEFKEADLFTLCYNSQKTWPEFKGFKLKTHWLNIVIRNHRIFKLLFPIATKAMEQWDFTNYDVIITSSATTAKYIKRFNALHICYCYFPTRAIWNFDAYFNGGIGTKEKLFSFFLNYFKIRDIAAAKRVNWFIAISESTKKAIATCYGSNSEVLFPPVDLERFMHVGIEKQSYFLIVSRLERWKSLDYAIEAFNELGLPLRIIGHGADKERLKTLAKSNITFVGGVNDETLSLAYAQAQAVIFTPELEYGLVPIEAIAAGTPVIALGRGGALETMIGVDDPGGREPTAVFFPEPNKDSLIEAVTRFKQVKFNSQALVAHAASFSVPEFRQKLRALVSSYVDLYAK